MSDQNFDVIVIGSGPGGYVCAIRAAQLGLKTACVEKRATLGGTCLNIGCIPSKALLQSSENFHEIAHGAKDHGIDIGEIKLDLARMQARKGEVVTANTKGVEFLFKKNKVTWLKGAAKFTSATEIDVAGTTYTAKNFVIATGSDSVPLKGVEVDEKKIVTSTGALELDAVPKHMVIIGGGVIGLELGSVWHASAPDVRAAVGHRHGVGELAARIQRGDRDIHLEVGGGEQEAGLESLDGQRVAGSPRLALSRAGLLSEVIEGGSNCHEEGSLLRC